LWFPVYDAFSAASFYSLGPFDDFLKHLIGAFRLELARTKPYAHSIFQLDNMVTLCDVLSARSDDLWKFEFPLILKTPRSAATSQSHSHYSGWSGNP